MTVKLLKQRIWVKSALEQQELITETQEQEDLETEIQGPGLETETQEHGLETEIQEQEELETGTQGHEEIGIGTGPQGQEDLETEIVTSTEEMWEAGGARIDTLLLLEITGGLIASSTIIIDGVELTTFGDQFLGATGGKTG